MKSLVLWLIKIYQKTLSLDHGWLGKILPNTRNCVYTPSCSQYTYDAIDQYGLVKGGWMGIKRISRCHPNTAHSRYDPVP